MDTVTTTDSAPLAAALAKSHSRIDLQNPERWVMYASHYDGPVRRLVVFVHGFLGRPVGTWLDFPKIDSAVPGIDWWLGSDLLFIGYRSTKDDITGVANRIRKHLPRFFPQPALDALIVSGVAARADTSSAYQQLVLVGHSLGGLIIRRALSDAAQQWVDSERSPAKRPILLDAENRMFSPASAGFRAAGLLGLARAVPLWRAIEMVARRASAYTDLQPDSVVLNEIKRRTEGFAPDLDEGLSALRANIIWASPDNVVVAERYMTDYVDTSCDKSTHTSVCKPHADDFVLPWTFVQTGRAI